MALVVNTNIGSLVAANHARSTQNDLEQAMERLSSGKRVNGAADDAAGVSISSRMTAQIRGLNQSVRNANDGISLAQTAEGALIEVENMLQRMRELAVQGATDTATAEDRDYLDLEYQALETEVDRIRDATQFNETNLFDGTTATSFTFQIGYSTASEDSINLSVATFGSLNFAVQTVASSSAAITGVDTALGVIRNERATLGAMINRLNYAVDNLSNIAMNTEAARSRIVDADFATESAALARAQILQQAGTAMLAQANAAPQSILALLQ